MDDQLLSLVSDRLDRSTISDDAGLLVLAACDRQAATAKTEKACAK
jgi:hypothetical protein